MQTSDNDADAETESATTVMMDDDDDGEEDYGSIIATTTTTTTGRNGFDAKAHQRLGAAALKPRTGRMKTRGGTRGTTTTTHVLVVAKKTSSNNNSSTKVVARSHARLGVSPVRGRGEKKMKESFLARKKEKKKRSVQQKRERREKRRYSLDGATSDDDDHDGGGGGGTDEDTEQQKRRRDTTNNNNSNTNMTAMEREDAKRRQLLYKRLDRLKQLPKNSKFAISQIALVNKCLEMLMKVTVRTNEEEDELAKLLSSVKI